MDIILGNFARSAAFINLSDVELALYKKLLDEQDVAIYSWVNGQTKPPTEYSALLAKIYPLAQ